jgi:hypothetical protein
MPAKDRAVILPDNPPENALPDCRAATGAAT